MIKKYRIAAALAAVLAVGLFPGTGLAQDGPPLYTEDQANAGKRLYDESCSLCHGPREFAGDVFRKRWFGQSVRNLFVHIRDTMPQDAPGSLKPEQVAAMVAYILELNKEPAGEKPLPTTVEALDAVRLPPPAPEEPEGIRPPSPTPPQR